MKDFEKHSQNIDCFTMTINIKIILLKSNPMVDLGPMIKALKK
jgi:hypothetical protein